MKPTDKFRIGLKRKKNTGNETERAIDTILQIYEQLKV